MATVLECGGRAERRHRFGFPFNVPGTARPTDLQLALLPREEQRHGASLLAALHTSAAVAAPLLFAASPARAQLTASLSIQADQPGARISSNLFGIFFEEINSAGDGGLYAELVRNRNFEEPGNTNYWPFISSGTASGNLVPDSAVPVSASNLYSARPISVLVAANARRRICTI